MLLALAAGFLTTKPWPYIGPGFFALACYFGSKTTMEDTDQFMSYEFFFGVIGMAVVVLKGCFNG